ncbi:MAG: ribonuclease HII [Candidatus Portnoybacteria bacterium]|nr:ribonuclease HII [Candidatus Portnoybacteria bacterium]
MAKAQDIFKEARKLYKNGYKCIAGVDEAGRGPLAGPVLACAAALKIRNSKHEIRNKSKILNLKFKKIRDSKKLSEKQREEWYKILTTHSDLKWAVAKVYPKTIDRINIFEATKLAMRRAVEKLNKKLRKTPSRVKNCTKLRDSVILCGIDVVIIDGNFYLSSHHENGSRDVTKTVLAAPTQKAIIKADEKVFSCMAASIIAKVTRDRIMRRAHEKYPQYGFDGHKGYGTKEHFEAIKKFGPCEIHRKSFKPMKKNL